MSKAECKHHSRNDLWVEAAALMVGGVAETDVLIVGGGVEGIATAYYLASEGTDVTVVERDRIGQACSWGNSGLIAVSQSKPLASLDALREGLRWILDPGGPVVIRPRLDARFSMWMARFVAECLRDRTGPTRALYEFSTFSADLHRELAVHLKTDYGYREAGWLHVFKSQQALARSIKAAADLQKVGVRSAVLDQVGVKKLEPTLSDDVIGGIYFLEDSQVQPYAFVESLALHAQQMGAHVITGTGVEAFNVSGRRVNGAITAAGEIKCKWIVIAAGAWTKAVGARLGLHLPIEPAKGYSLTFASDRRVSLPIMLAEPHVTVTSHGSSSRVTSGLELVGFNSSRSEKRFSRMLAAPREYLVGFEAKPGTEWVGFRPQTPDDLPIIGPAPRWDNVIIASGHGTLGITLAPATGRVIADLLLGSPQQIDTSRFLPSRFRF